MPSLWRRRSYAIRTLVATALSSILAAAPAGCGEAGPGQEELPHRIIRIADYIGVESGDSILAFGSIDRLCFMPDGTILALDRISCRIMNFDMHGNLMGTAGGRGSGPGEYLNPSDMAVLGDGRVVVCDIFTGGVHLLDSGLVDRGLWIPFSSDPPFLPVGAAGASFVAGCLQLEPVDDAFECTFTVGRFDSVPEQSTVYFTNVWTADPTQFTTIVDNVMHSAAWTADRSGNVFIAPMTFDSYEITGVSADGTEFLSISRPVEPVPRTPEEIEEEKLYIERKLTSMGSSLLIDYEPSPWRYQIRELGVDGEGNVWVLRGTEQVPTFDVYGPDGEPAFTASIPDAGPDGLFWRFAIGAAGMIAWSEDPPDYPRIFILELE